MRDSDGRIHRRSSPPPLFPHRPEREGSTKVPFNAPDSGAALPRYRCIDDEAEKESERDKEKEREIAYNDAKLTRETGDKHVLSMRVSLSRSSDTAESDSSAETRDCAPFSLRFLRRRLGPPSPNRPRNRVRRIVGKQRKSGQRINGEKDQRGKEE